MINQDEIYEMAWDFMKERYEIDLETCEDYYFLDELKILAVHCEFIFAAIGSCENEKILQSVMNSLCRVWESGGSYERTEKEDEFEIFRDVLDTILYKWEQGKLKELKEIKL